MPPEVRDDVGVGYLLPGADADTRPGSVLIMNFGRRRAWTVEVANALAVSGIETTLLVLGPATWMLPADIPLDRGVRIEFLSDYLERHRWESWRDRMVTALDMGEQVGGFGGAGATVRMAARVCNAGLTRADMIIKPLLLASSAMRCLAENSIPDPDVVVAADLVSLPAADNWRRRHPDRPVLIARAAADILRDLGIEPTGVPAPASRPADVPLVPRTG